jgi:hypothetical protein
MGWPIVFDGREYRLETVTVMMPALFDELTARIESRDTVYVRAIREAVGALEEWLVPATSIAGTSFIKAQQIADERKEQTLHALAALKALLPEGTPAP